jgi:hypothetical protein
MQWLAILFIVAGRILLKEDGENTNPHSIAPEISGYKIAQNISKRLFLFITEM